MKNLDKLKHGKKIGESTEKTFGHRGPGKRYALYLLVVPEKEKGENDI